jgi:hypothetical protein
MAMINCHECKAEISSTAKACPKCGAKVPTKPIWPWLLGVPFGLLILMMIWGTTIPDYEHDARAARSLCEDLMKRQGNAYGLRQCDSNYAEAIERGKREQRERTR